MHCYALKETSFTVYRYTGIPVMLYTGLQAAGCRLGAVGCRLLAVSCRLRAVDCKLLAVYRYTGTRAVSCRLWAGLLEDRCIRGGSSNTPSSRGVGRFVVRLSD